MTEFNTEDWKLKIRPVVKLNRWSTDKSVSS